MVVQEQVQLLPARSMVDGVDVSLDRRAGIVLMMCSPEVWAKSEHWQEAMRSLTEVCGQQLNSSPDVEKEAPDGMCRFHHYCVEARRQCGTVG